MDPVSHAIIGAAISKLTGNGIDFSTSANIAIVIGSIFPDIDIALKSWGDYVYQKNHRAFTHSVLGLFVSAAFIAFVLKLALPGSNILITFIWSLIGCLSHTVFDILNSYGAKLLWPFYNKKMALDLLIIIDPLLILILTGYIFTSGGIGQLFLVLLMFYLISRLYTRYLVIKELKKRFSPFFKLSVLPSMLGLFRWHFVLDKGNYTLIGEKNILTGKIYIIDRLQKIDNQSLNKVLDSPVGVFFSDFTPLFHVSFETVGKIKRYVFTDLRYYVKDDFFHHAVLELDENDSVIKSGFNPYSMNRYSTIPIHPGYYQSPI